MKRFFLFVSTLFLCTFLVGCSGDSYEGLIDDTISLLKSSATEVGIIKNEVNKAVEKYNKSVKEGNPQPKLDLSEAIKAAEKLKKTGETAQEIKRRIEQVRSRVTEQQKEENAKNKRGDLNEAVKTLLRNQQELSAALDAAEKLNPPASKIEVDRLRQRIADAESPFEALGRQQQ